MAKKLSDISNEEIINSLEPSEKKPVATPSPPITHQSTSQQTKHAPLDSSSPQEKSDSAAEDSYDNQDWKKIDTNLAIAVTKE